MGLGPNPTISISSDASEMSDDEVSEASPSSMDTDEKTVPQVYKGHMNSETVKGVNFFGPKCEYVVSGSDCGRIFIRKKKGGELIRVMKGDENVVNCIGSHPHTMVLASSGIENDIKMWTPKALERATLPENIDQKPKHKSWMSRPSPQLMLELFSLQRWTSSPEHTGENSSADLELMLTLDANNDDSSGDEDEEDDDDNSSQGDSAF